RMTVDHPCVDSLCKQFFCGKDHPWFLGCQFHPEFKSNPMRPHPLFREFIKATKTYKEKKDS
ncbi:MAG: hypothetical protein SVS15_01760, partial [Thermodesulfobacteriota bacterium]|nr:hypothetical protein [Thermodesulfobacteriota bacterium]